MWGRRDKSAAAAAAEPRSRAQEAMHQARVEAAERTSVVVDLRDAEVARLELLNEALDPVFAEIPSEAELFDRGLSRGDTPRLWIDAVAHIAMGRDKRLYRLLHDTRVRPHASSPSRMNIPDMVRRGDLLCGAPAVERERALDRGPRIHHARSASRRRGASADARWQAAGALLFGFVLGLFALLLAGLLLASRLLISLPAIARPASRAHAHCRSMFAARPRG